MMKRMQRRHDSRQRRLGTAMVELAVVLPVFFMVILGIIEFGRAMMVSQLITNAAREGARLAIVDGTSNAEVKEWIAEFLEASTNAPAGDVVVTITVTPADGNPDPGNDVSVAKPRDLCEVVVDIPFESVQLIPGDYLHGTLLTGRSAMRHE